VSEPNEDIREQGPAEEAEPETPTEASEGAEAISPEEQERLALVEERDRLKDQLLRTAADFDNFRKRSRRDIEDAQRRAQEETLRELLPIVDNLERAVQATEHAKDVDAVAEGIRMVLRSFEDVAVRLGLDRVPALGQRFDPNVHDAVQQVETDEHPAGTVVAEVQPGYVLREKLVRPALVVVAKPPAKPAEPKPN
jgi:molecular chaperone GrpE